MKFIITKIACLLILTVSSQALIATGEQEKATSPEGYISPANAIAKVQELGQKEGVKIIQIATTPGGRQILALAFAEKDVPGRPAILIVADPTGDRPVGTQIALALCEAKIDSPLFNAATVYVVPVANPDAAEHAFTGGDPWRGGAVDEDRDGLMDEDPPEDLNGDGLILQMRIADPTGEWCMDNNDPRSMRRANRDKGESGGWRLLREGIDNDSDRQFNEDGHGGVQLEANWPHRWREHDIPSGRFQLSEPETHGLADFMLERPNIVLVIVLGAEDNISQPPEGIDKVEPQSTEPLKQDAALIKLLADRILKDVKDRPRTAEHGSGNFADWAYYHFGALVLESSVWSAPADEKESKETDDKDKASDDVKLLRWNDLVLAGKGFVNWTPFKHPQLGDVEIGGWKPFVQNNPPAGEIEALAKQWISFLDSLAGDFARLSWEKMEVRELGGGIYDARITLVNNGGPTGSQMSEITRRPLPLRILLELPEGSKLLIGRRIHSIPRMKGLGDYREFRWVYKLPEGADPARVRVVSQTAGEAIAVLNCN